jgi:hypothetical protein
LAGTRKNAGLVAGVVLVGLLAAAPALAGTSVTRFAEPNGDGASPCAESDPCEIQNAVETVAQPGDTVVLLPGTYPLDNDELQIGNDVDVTGEAAFDAVTLTSTATVAVRLLFASSSASLANVTIDHDSSASQSAGLAVENGTAQRVYVDSTGDSACTTIGLLRDSICVNSDPDIGNGVATVSGSAATGVLRNVTAIALGTTSGNALFASATGAGDFQVTMDGRNVIAQGATIDQRGFDSNVNTASSHIDLDYSNFDTLDFTPVSGASGTGVDTFNNQSALPLLDSSYHQLPDSPTIDAGNEGATLLGSEDIDLEPRVQGEDPDIGADEFLPLPEDTDAPDTEITKQPKRKTTKRKAKLKFSSSEAGSTFECKLDKKPFKPCESPFKKKVKAGKKHKFLVRATDATGNTDPTPAKAKWKVLEKD